jgi:hypothetical protein
LGEIPRDKASDNNENIKNVDNIPYFPEEDLPFYNEICKYIPVKKSLSLFYQMYVFL